MFRQSCLTAALLAALVVVSPQPAESAEIMCDPSYQDCRAMLLSRIQNEQIAIDVAMQFMEDDVMADALIARHNAGIRVRALVDPRRTAITPKNGIIVERLKNAGIPMRAKVGGGGMLHWKFMIFDSQNVVQFSAANYSDYYFRPAVPYADYTDEGIYFCDDPPLVDSFRRKFDDAWIDTTAFTNYANVGTPARVYPLYPIDPALSFVPAENFATRSVPLYDAEQQQIDTSMYKITESRHADGLIRAAARGVIVRLMTEPNQYRDRNNIWQAYHVDRLYMAGVQIRNRAHAGFLHQKSTVLYGQGLTIFGSSNWTSNSNSSQYEHNYFTDKAWFLQWFKENFDRKWRNRTGNVETAPFVPLPPAAPVYGGPAHGATGVSTSGVSLSWNPGLWGHRADVYFGTAPTPPLVAANVGVTASATARYALPALAAGTTYYWRIVNKTIAQKTAAGPVYAFTTAGGSEPPPPSNAAPSVSISSPAANSTFTAPANIAVTASASDSDGTLVRVDFYNGSTLIGSDTSAPYQMGWANVAAGSYTLSARATDDDGAITRSSGIAVTVTATPAASLPAPWRAQDIGAVGPAGTSSASSGRFDVRGAGADVWGAADAFHYVWRQITGDVDVVARVASVQAVHAWTKAGVMIRERLTADSPHAFMLVSPGKGLAFQRRVTTGGASTNTAGGTGVAPAWVKLSRRGQNVTAFRSTDGVAWTAVGSQTFTMGAQVYVGLAVSSHDATRLASAAFDNVAVTAAGTAPAGVREIVLHAGDATARAGTWQLVTDDTAAGGQRAWNPNAGRAKVVTAAAAPTDYVELTFDAESGRAYRLWIRGKAERNSWANDSVHVQFSGSVSATGAARYRIGSTSSTEYNLESCSGCGLAGWGWEDNGWGTGVAGPLIYFAATGPQRIRIQTREDGLSFDQIVLSSGTYLDAAPGPTKNATTLLEKQ